MYYVIVVCPPEGVAVPLGYELTKAEREIITSKLVGIPITVQHAHVEQRIAKIPKSTPLNAALMQQELDSCGMVVGSWMDATNAILAIIFVHQECIRVIDLIEAGHLSSVSLTHVKSTSQPVEITLCTIPARPGCKIVFASRDLKDAYAYKANKELKEISNMEVTPATEKAKTPLQAIMDGLPAESRELIQARLAEMMTAVDKAREEKSTAESKMETLKKMTEVDQTLMKSHLDHWRSVMGNELDAYGLAIGANGQDCALEMLSKADPGVQHTVSNIIKCASAHMAKQAPVPETPRAKRKASAIEEVESPAEIGGSVIERALAAQFM